MLAEAAGLTLITAGAALAAWHRLHHLRDWVPSAPQKGHPSMASPQPPLPTPAMSQQEFIDTVVKRLQEAIGQQAVQLTVASVKLEASEKQVASLQAQLDELRAAPAPDDARA